MKAKFKRILVALSCQNSAREVFERSLALAQQDHSSLILTHCTRLKIWEQMGTLIDAGCGLVSRTKLQQLDQGHHQEIHQAYQWLCAYVLEAESRGVFAEMIHRIGEPTEQICHLAQDSKADLIVMGRSKKLNLKQRLLGDKMNHIVTHAPCSVMVVQSANTPDHLPPYWTSKFSDAKASLELNCQGVGLFVSQRIPIPLIL